MPKQVYAEDLEKLEDELESVEGELAEHRAKPKIIRRLLQGKIEALEKRAHDLGWQMRDARAQVQNDPTSSTIYEDRYADRQEQKALKKKRKALGKDSESEAEPE